ncbi:hypothetical protein OIU76_027411 [Salix suchowensis]|nr:hypothetical protein OIU76_027411 [Salix suchowensis]
MAAINFGGILLRMPELSYDNEEGYGIVLELVLGLFQGRDMFHSLPMLMLIQWSLQGLFLSKTLKFSWKFIGPKLEPDGKYPADRTKAISKREVIEEHHAG